MHNQALKRKLYVIIFEADTPAGKLFDVTLIWCILLSVGLVILESLQGLPGWLKTPFIVMEYLLTAFFTFEYITRLYCSPKPSKYAFSAFGIIDLLATLPLYLAFLFPGARYLLIIRAFRLIRIFRVFKLFNFWMEGQMLLTALRDSSKTLSLLSAISMPATICAFGSSATSPVITCPILPLHPCIIIRTIFFSSIYPVFFSFCRSSRQISHADMSFG